MDKMCVICQKMYHAKRADSKYCSAACRKAASRQVSEEPVAKVVPKPVDEWANSAETKTQAEIEEHYSLKNFPRVKYYSQNGGGSGALSPYPLSDPRSQAYL